MMIITTDYIENQIEELEMNLAICLCLSFDICLNKLMIK